MRLLRIATWLFALIFSLSSLGWGAEVSYSGIPGKWTRKPKGAKAAAPEAKTMPQNQGAKKIIDNDKLKVTVGPKKG
jgi:hypothetical protein